MPSNGPSERIPSSTETSRSLLALLKESDPEAWDRLVSLYSPLIYCWCRRMGLPEQDMPDLFQEVFHAVARNIQNFRRDQPGDTFRGWLRTVTENKVRDYYRKAGREPQPVGGTDAQRRFSELPSMETLEESLDSENTTEDQHIYNELFHRALSSIRPHFGEQTWQAFWRVVVDGRTAQEVGLELSMQPGTVRVAKSRVLHRLRQELGDLPE